MRIVIAAPGRDGLADFQAALEAGGARVVWADSAACALDLVRDMLRDTPRDTPGAPGPLLVVIAPDLPDMEPLALVKAILMTNAMANTAVMSDMDEEEFHERSEGLGILARLPLRPGPGDAARLLAALGGLGA